MEVPGSARSSIAEGSSGNPFVTGELALGNLRQRGLVLSALRELPQATVATDEEVPHFIDRRTLFGLGSGYVDAHLLASRPTDGRGPSRRRWEGMRVKRRPG